ncbi:MAG: UDP-N-acetylmuramoyl-L-alanyl-D-glutamate--2,6-diaminopimelate ligase [Bacteroidota bacterium]|nr:UDP-N-acetylmuramoyl-L-alanyl-D-glutamate--2,6-diaminopimelate ligase [Bacteroidota bacterium]
MAILKEILEGLNFEIIQGNLNNTVLSVEFDSRKVKNDSLFVAVKGTQTDGHKFINQTIENGAKHIICSTTPEKLIKDINYLKVKDSSLALAIAIANFYDNPSRKLILVGVTGTNGKTTVATLLHSLFQNLGYKSALFSTIKIKIGEEEKEATHTTPDSLQLNKLFAEMIDKGCKYCFMEVSSHAIVQNRVAGLDFNGGIFTNITHDHLDYHKSFDNYINAKKLFFDSLQEKAFALVNSDDVHSKVMLQNTNANKKTYALKNAADFKAKILESDFSGIHLKIDNNDFYTDKIGKFNAYNLMAVYGVATLLGISADDSLKVLSSPINVEGRFEILRNSKGVIGIIDYAHTPDALKNVLETIYAVNNKKHKIFTVFGCGGNRDKEKRPIMGQISANYSDTSVITSDNPRFEDFNEILIDIEKGLNEEQMKKSITISDREQAIKTASKMAQEGDIILVAGKGHEKYQDIKGEKFPFDDKEKLNKYLNL